MRAVFAGTPVFGAICLEKLCQGGLSLAGVLTQPDRPRGRGRQLQPSPVKRVAQKAGLSVLEAGDLRDPATLEIIEDMRPDVLLTAAYGRILPAPLLTLPRLGCVNLHPSLLPRHRGAAPIHRCLLAGDRVSGVTTFLMGNEVDAGPLLLQKQMVVNPLDNAGTLLQALAHLGGDLLLETALRLDRGQVVAREQDEARMTMAPPLRRAEEFFNWSQPAWRLECQVRALSPSPGACTVWKGKEVKIRSVTLPNRCQKHYGEAPGTVLGVHSGKGFLVATGVGALSILEVQPAGKKTMSADAFVRGYELCTGDILGGPRARGDG